MNLKELRTKKGLLQKDVAEKLGIGRTTYVRYETGQFEPDIKTLIRLADIFGVTVDYLIGREAAACADETPLTDKELALITAYRNNPAMQSAVDKLLGVPSEPASDLVEDIVSELLPTPASVQK